MSSERTSPWVGELSGTSRACFNLSPTLEFNRLLRLDVIVSSKESTCSEIDCGWRWRGGQPWEWGGHLEQLLTTWTTAFRLPWNWGLALVVSSPNCWSRGQIRIKGLDYLRGKYSQYAHANEYLASWCWSAASTIWMIFRSSSPKWSL